VNLLELAMLFSKGRIQLKISLESFISNVEARFRVLPITGRICVQAFDLPKNYPKDPVDRIIGATGMVEGLSLVTADRAIRNSRALPTIW
jgi:PIN domain nuclease of toxin-antitoxin system